MSNACGAFRGPAFLGQSLAVFFLLLSYVLPTACGKTTANSEYPTRSGSEFSTLTDEFIEGSAGLTEKLNLGYSTGDFSAISDSAETLIGALSDTVTKMEKLVPDLHENLSPIASEIVSAGRRWLKAASDALRAGLSSDPAAFLEARSVLDREREAINLSIRKWNLAIDSS